MGKNQSASNLPNIIQHNNGSINFVSGSTLLMQISSSGAITTTGIISGSNALSSSYSQNADLLDNLDSTSFVFTSSFNSYSSSISTRVTNTESTGSSLITASGSFSTRVTNTESTGSSLTTASSSFSTRVTNTESTGSSLTTASGSFSTRISSIEGNYATTGSNVFMGAQTVCANITSTGTIIAQTINVQQVTSSIVYSSGSNIFGNLSSDVQQMTGSLRITGSLNTIGNACVTSICSPTFVGGTVSGTTIYGSTAICGAVICGGATTLTGALSGTSATFSSSVTIGGTSPVYLNFNAQASCRSRVAILYRGTQSGDVCMITEYGTPYLSIGGQENLVNSIQTIGFGFTNGTTYAQPAEIGFQTTSTSGYTCGDLVFATRGATTNTSPSERLRITSTGIACFQNTVCTPMLLASGCVGIGTTSPSNTALHIVADWVSNNSTVKVQPSTGTTSGYGVYDNTGARKGIFYRETGYVAIETNSEPLLLNTNGIERMRIASTGVASFACYICTPSIYLTCTSDAKICVGSGIGLNIDGAALYLNRFSNSSIVAGGSIIPLCNGKQDLGSANCRWCTVYTSDLSLNNGIGNYTIVEGENDLFLYNNNSCKVYKFIVQEVCPEIAPAKRSI